MVVGYHHFPRISMFLPDGGVCGVNQIQGPSEEDKSRDLEIEKDVDMIWLIH